MSKKLKKSNTILLFVEQIIYGFSENTAPSVKSSERNKLVANAALAVNELRKYLHTSKSKK